MLRNELKIAIRFTLLTTVVLGIFYPLAVTAVAHLVLPREADGELIVTDAEKLRETVANGIGPQKAYGFGLLSLAPVA